MFDGSSLYNWLVGKLELRKPQSGRRRKVRRSLPPTRTRKPVFEQEEDRSMMSGLVSMSSMGSSVPEGSPAGAMIMLSGSATGTVTANWESVPGTATAGNDYTHASGSVQLSSMMSFQTVYVNTLTDATYDPNETFSIVITSVTGDATLGSPSSAQITIQDNSPPGGGCGTPTGISVASPGTLNEGQNFNLHVTLSPPCNYMISGTTNWGNSPGMGGESFSTYAMSDGQFWLPHQYWDDGTSPGNGTASDNETITVTVGSLVGTTNATVVNIAPVGSGFSLTDVSTPGGPTWRLEGFIQDVVISNDVIDVTIDWGDGSPPTELNGLPPTSSVFQEHTFPMEGGTFTVEVTVTDDDTGEWTWSDSVETVGLEVITWEEIIVNDDDDNDDGIVDLDPTQSPVTNEDELFPVNVSIVNPAGIDLTGYSVVFQTIGPIALWQSLDKANPIVIGSSYSVEALPSIFVEGKQESGATIFVQLRKPSGGTASSKYRDLFIARTRLMRDGADVGFLAQNVWVSEKMAMSVDGGPIASVEWTGVTAPSAIKNYDPSPSLGEVEELTAFDLGQPILNFYWVQAGARFVNAKVTLSDPTFGQWTVNRAVKFTVKRPVNVNVTSETDTTHIFRDPVPGLYVAQVEFGTLDDPDTPQGMKQSGIIFTRHIDAAAGGKYKWVQVLDTELHREIYIDGVLRSQVMLSDGFVLDWTTLGPYEYAGDVEKTADSPRWRLTPDERTATNNDSYKMYLMWTKNTPGSIYVPMCVTDWSWSWAAHYDPNDPNPNSYGGWVLDTASNSIDPPSQDTTEFPEWTQNFDDLEWEFDDD